MRMKRFVESAAGRLGDLNIHLDLTSPSPARSMSRCPRHRQLAARASSAQPLPDENAHVRAMMLLLLLQACLRHVGHSVRLTGAVA